MPDVHELFDALTEKLNGGRNELYTLAQGRDDMHLMSIWTTEVECRLGITSACLTTYVVLTPSKVYSLTHLHEIMTPQPSRPDMNKRYLQICLRGSLPVAPTLNAKRNVYHTRTESTAKMRANHSPISTSGIRSQRCRTAYTPTSAACSRALFCTSL